MKFKVVNTTYTFSTERKIDLNDLNKHMWNTSYKGKNGKGRNSLRFELRNPNFTALILSTGKVIIVGLSSIKYGQVAANIVRKKLFQQKRKLSNELVRIYPNPRVTDLQLKNVVIAGQVGYLVCLKKKYQNLQNARDMVPRYDPDRFAGLMCNMNVMGNICATVFRSGKVQLTGSESKIKL